MEETRTSLPRPARSIFGAPNAAAATTDLILDHDLALVTVVARVHRTGPAVAAPLGLETMKLLLDDISRDRLAAHVP